MSKPPRNPSAWLPPGYTLRPMRPEDAEFVSDWLVSVFGVNTGEPDVVAGIWAREMLRPGHPTTPVETGRVVIDEATGQIVATAFLLLQTWIYDGIPFAVGRPELIGSDPTHRGKRLIHALMDSLHEESDELGIEFLAITGIPVYYRQFEYFPSLVTEPARAIQLEDVPPASLAPGRLRLREVSHDDLPQISRLYAKAAARSRIAAVRDEIIWNYEFFERDPNSDYAHVFTMVELDGISIGFMARRQEIETGEFGMTVYEIEDDALWPALAGDLLRQLTANVEDVNNISFDWTPNHPLVTHLGELAPVRGIQFPWYVRVPNLVAFLKRIAPALERRLADSPLAGLDRDLTIVTFPGAISLSFRGGVLTNVEAIPQVNHRHHPARMPIEPLLTLILGTRSVAELEYAWPGEFRVINDETRELLEILFPKGASAIWPIA